MSYLSARGSGDGDGGFIVASRSNLISSRGNDNSCCSPSMSEAWTTPRTSNPFADEEPISEPPSSALAVSPRLDSYPAHCISLVTTSPASEHSPEELLGGGARSLRACHQLLASVELAYLPGVTGSVAQERIVPPVRPTSASVAVASGSALAAVSTSHSASSTSTSIPMCTSGEEPLVHALFVRALLNVARPAFDLDNSCQHISRVPTHLEPQRIYELRVSHIASNLAGSTHGMLMLVLSPPAKLRLLRSEQWIVKSEAVVVKWIRSVLLAGDSATTTATAIAHVDTESNGTTSDGMAVRNLQRSQLEDDDVPFKDLDLSELLPALIDHSQITKDISSAYNILSHLSGLSLSSFSTALSISERSHVDFQAGRLVRRLSHLPSPSGKFGPAISVLCPTALEQSKAGGSMGRPGGMDSWSLAFHAMLEGILRDAEDMAVTIPYQTIRRHFRRLSHYLNEVTVPRLVIIDAAHDSNIMAERTGAEREARPSHTHLFRDLLEDSDGASGNNTGGKSRREMVPDIRITGLRYWSNCVFGDPLVATVFNEKPSRDFLRGFDGRPRRRAGHDSIVSELRGCVGEDGESAELRGETHVRLLLYQCYHATMAVVKEFYRPHSDSTNRELAARKRLNAVLARLNEVETGSKKYHARPSSETSPSKKPKTEDKSGWGVSQPWG